MSHYAFITTQVLDASVSSSCQYRSLGRKLRTNLTAMRPNHWRICHHNRVQMQERWGASEANDSAGDDERLHHELRVKVRELYGSRENVAIVTDGLEDTVEFRVRRGPDGMDYTSYRAAVFTVGGIITSAIISLLFFVYLVKVGAVHDAKGTQQRHEMPTYGSRTYIDPYDLLQEDTPVIK